MPKAWIEKARRAVETADLVRRAGDFDATVNRAYYAMFYAANAVMLHLDPEASARTKTHRTLIGGFGRLAVRTGLAEVELGRWFNAAADLRVACDYGAGSFDDPAAASTTLERSRRFVEAARRIIEQPRPETAAP